MSASFKAALALMLAVGVAGLEWKVWHSGKCAGMAEVQQKWDRQVAATEQAVREETAVHQQVITKTVTKFVEKAAQEKVVYRDIIREVPNYVPSDLPVLPGSFRVLHDAAATGSALPEGGGAGGVDAGAVSPENVAVILTENYSACRLDKERLRLLQEVVRGNTILEKQLDM